MMTDKKTHLYTEGSQHLQIPFVEYENLMEAVEEGLRLNKIKASVLANLRRIGTGTANKESEPIVVAKVEPETKEGSIEPEKVSIEFSAEESKESVEEESIDSPVTAKEKVPLPGNTVTGVPPIKNDVAEHFNKVDTSGRLLNVFKQYYTCINEACGGTVRVTIKDGFCSLWNYDEWEEFAFVDIFDTHLRIAIDPRYTDELKSLNLCEVPRFLASRSNFICVQVDNLNNKVLDVLNKAFAEVGTTAR
jgi:hypothetical protein